MWDYYLQIVGLPTPQEIAMAEHFGVVYSPTPPISPPEPFSLPADVYCKMERISQFHGPPMKFVDYLVQREKWWPK